MPKARYEELTKAKRYSAVKSAILHQLDAGLSVPPEWIDEYNDLNQLYEKSSKTQEKTIVKVMKEHYALPLGALIKVYDEDNDHFIGTWLNGFTTSLTVKVRKDSCTRIENKENIK